MITQWLVEHSSGLIKNDKQAEYLLLGAVVVVFILSIMFFLFGGSQPDFEQSNNGYQGMELPDDFR